MEGSACVYHVGKACADGQVGTEPFGNVNNVECLISSKYVSAISGIICAYQGRHLDGFFTSIAGVPCTFFVDVKYVCSPAPKWKI